MPQPSGDTKPERRPAGGISLPGGAALKFEYRVRETHVATHLAPLLSRKAAGAVKLDLVLRALAFLPEDAGAREPGSISGAVQYEQLHDLCRGAHLGPHGQDLTADDRDKKVKWVGEQLKRLEDLNLVQRVLRPGNRPRLFVLSDRGDGAPYDDPTGKGENDSYVRLLGKVISNGHLATFSGPEVAAYIAAMIAERSDPNGKSAVPGRGRWWRQHSWFADVERYGPPGRVAIPFSADSLQRGFKDLEERGLVATYKTTTAPRTRARLRGPRVIYTNQFVPHDAGSQKARLARRVKDADADAETSTGPSPA